VTLADPARGDDDAVDPPLGQQLEVGRLTLRVFGRVAQEDGVASLPGRVLGRSNELRVERVGDVGDDETERPRRPDAE
jgi:hypothetical protein